MCPEIVPLGQSNLGQLPGLSEIEPRTIAGIIRKRA